MVDLRCCMWAFSSCGEFKDLSFGGSSCCGVQAQGIWTSVVAASGLSSCGSQALELELGSCGAWA